MTHIKYVGTSNFRELGAADLAKAEVDGFRKTTFVKDEPTEVSDEAAKALVENESGLFDEEFEAVKDEELEAHNLATGKSKAATQDDDPQDDDPEIAASGTPQEGVDSATTAGRRARGGTSTATSTAGTGAGNGSSTATS
jgi:hypothetical protein